MTGTSGISREHRAGCSKRPPSKAAASERPEAFPLGLNDARTTLTDFFSILARGRIVIL